MDSFSISSSEAPKDARPMSCGGRRRLTEEGSATISWAPTGAEGTGMSAAPGEPGWLCAVPQGASRWQPRPWERASACSLGAGPWLTVGKGYLLIISIGWSFCCGLEPTHGPQKA